MKKWLKEYFSYGQNLIACICVLITAVALFYMLFCNPRLGAADFGEYDQILYRMGLSRTQEDLANEQDRYFTKIVTAYHIESVDDARLFGAIPTESMIYPVRLATMICKLFGDTFYLDVLTGIYCLLILLAVYLLCKGLYTYLGNKTLIVGALIILCLLHSDTTSMLRSLYSDGMVIVSSFLLLAASVKAFTDNDKIIHNMIFWTVSAYLFLTSSESMPLLAPAVLVAGIGIGWKIYKKAAERRYMILVVLAGLYLVISCVRFVGESEQLNSKINLYAATFHGAYLYEKDRKDAFAHFDLSEEHAQDVGKSFFLPEEEYLVAPYTKEADEVLYSKISYGKLAGFYLAHPRSLWHVIDTNLSVSKRMNTEKYLAINNGKDKVTYVNTEKLGYYPILRSILAPGTLSSFSVWMLVLLAGILFLFGKQWARKRRTGYATFVMPFLCLYIWCVCISRLLVTGFVYGTFQNRSTMFGFQFWFDILVVTAIYSLCHEVAQLVSVMEQKAWEEHTEPAYVRIAEGPLSMLTRRIKRGLSFIQKNIIEDEVKGSVFITCLAGLFMLAVLFIPERIGAYNNGDFGRMMDAMGLYYTDYDLLHQDEQYVTKVIEQYVWLDNFDWSTVTSLNPTMTQVFLAVFVKLTAGAMGFLYSTVYATVIYWILMTIGFGLTVYGMYKLFGRKTLYLSTALIVILFGSYNMGWFNSLFSEATEMCGWMLVMGSSFWLLTKARGETKWYDWLFLMSSIRFFVGAKSQVTVEMMVLAFWAMSLAVYHIPRHKETEKIVVKRYIIQIMAVLFMVILTARSAVIIFQKDNEISSGDTTYSSVFSGVLMVADDPAIALDELGLDERLIQDVGKNPYLGEGAYFCQPRTEMAQQMIYSKVNTFKVLGWYLKHPSKLWKMLDHAAEKSAEPMPDYFLYVGEKTTEEHRTVSKLNLWGAIRSSVTPRHFLSYLIWYGALVCYCLYTIFGKKKDIRVKMFCGFVITLVGAAALQFPLSVIGNGFIDNTKQLFMFRLLHDMIFAGTIYFVVVFFLGKGEKKHE